MTAEFADLFLCDDLDGDEGMGRSHQLISMNLMFVIGEVLLRSQTGLSSIVFVVIIIVVLVFSFLVTAFFM